MAQFLRRSHGESDQGIAGRTIFWAALLFTLAAPVGATLDSGGPTSVHAARLEGTGAAIHTADSLSVLLKDAANQLSTMTITAGSLRVAVNEELVTSADVPPPAATRKRASEFRSETKTYEKIEVTLDSWTQKTGFVYVRPNSSASVRGHASLRGTFNGTYTTNEEVVRGHPFETQDVSLEPIPPMRENVSRTLRVDVAGDGLIRLEGSLRLHVYGARVNLSTTTTRETYWTGRERSEAAGGTYSTNRYVTIVMDAEGASLELRLNRGAGSVYAPRLRTHVVGNATLFDATGHLRASGDDYELSRSVAVISNAAFEWTGREGGVAILDAQATRVEGSGIRLIAPSLSTGDPLEPNLAAAMPAPTGPHSFELWVLWAVLGGAAVVVCGVLLKKASRPTVIWWAERRLAKQRSSIWREPWAMRLARYFRRSALRAEQRGHYRAAARRVGHAIHVLPDDPQLYLMRAIYRTRLKRYADAIADHKRAHAFFRTMPEDHDFAHNAFEAARASALKDEPDAAMYWLQIALTSNPDLSTDILREPDFVPLHRSPGFRWLIDGSIAASRPRSSNAFVSDN